MIKCAAINGSVIPEEALATIVVEERDVQESFHHIINYKRYMIVYSLALINFVLVCMIHWGGSVMELNRLISLIRLIGIFQLALRHSGGWTSLRNDKRQFDARSYRCSRLELDR